MLKKVLLSTLVVATTLCAMHEFEINLNQKDLDLHLGLDMGQFNDSIEPDSFLVQMRVMKGDTEHSNLPGSQDTNLFGDLGFVAQSSSAMAPGLTMGMGLKLIYTDLKYQSSFAMPLGVTIDYVLPFDIFVPLHIGGKAYYAPEVLAFEASKNYMEFQTNFDIEVMDRGLITLGYRWIETPLKEQTNAYYNRSYYFGLKFKF